MVPSGHVRLTGDGPRLVNPVPNTLNLLLKWVNALDLCWEICKSTYESRRSGLGTPLAVTNSRKPLRPLSTNSPYCTDFHFRSVERRAPNVRQ